MEDQGGETNYQPYQQPGNQPSPSNYGPEDLKKDENKAVGRSANPYSSSTTPGKINYTGQPQAGAGGPTDSATAPGQVGYNSSGDVPPAEQSFFNSSQTTGGRARFGGLLSTGKRKAAAGGIATATVAGVVFLFSLFSGPLQFVHIAQTLTHAYFAPFQDQSDSRAYRLARFVHYNRQGTLESTRLSIAGNIIANYLEKQLNAAGIETSYTEKLGFRDGIIIDPEILPPDSGFGDLKNSSQAEIAASFKQNFNIDIKTTMPDGTKLGGRRFFVPMDKIGYVQNGKITKIALASTNTTKKFSIITARIMGERAGVTWHPLKRIDNAVAKSAEKAYLNWKQRQATTIDEGVSEAAIRANDSSPRDSNGNPTNQPAANTATAEAEAANGANQEGNDTAQKVQQGDSGAVPGFTDHIAVKVSGLGAGAVGILCALRSVGAQAESLKQTNVVLPLIRYGVQYISLGNQIMSGQGVDLQQLHFFNQQLNGVASANQKRDSKGNLVPGSPTSSWSDARVFQALNGQPQTGPAPSSTLGSINKNDNPFGVLEADGLGTFLSGACGTFVQIAGGIIGFLGGPVSFLATTAAGAAFGPQLMSTAAHWLSHDAIDVFAQGADAGYNMAYGSRLAANSQATSAGGRVLNQNEESSNTTYENSLYSADFASQSTAHKLFSLTDPRSAIAKLIDKSSPSPRANFAKIGSFFASFGHFFSGFFSMFSGHAKAATTSYDYGFPATGFSQEEMSDPAVANPYQNAYDVVTHILPAHLGYIDLAKKCFGITIDPKSFDITSWQAGTPAYTDKELESGDCALAPDRADCSTDTTFADDSCNWLKLRFYIFDSQTAEGAACYYGDDSSCSDVGFGGTSGTATVAGSTADTSAYKDPLRGVQGLSIGRIDQGVDYGGSGPVYAIGNGKVNTITTTASWPGGVFISYSLSDGPASGKNVFIAEHCTPVKGLGTTIINVTPATVICNMTGGANAIETGWAADPSAGFVAAAHDVYAGKPDGDATAYGQNFSDFMKAIGSSPGDISQSTSPKLLGALPAGWPTW